MPVVYLGETFPGYNKPKRAPTGSKHKFVVLAKDGDRVRKVSFGARGYEDFTQHKDAGRRANFHARHNCSEKTDKLTAGYWACRKLW